MATEQGVGGDTLAQQAKLHFADPGQQVYSQTELQAATTGQPAAEISASPSSTDTDLTRVPSFANQQRGDNTLLTPTRNNEQVTDQTTIPSNDDRKLPAVVDDTSLQSKKSASNVTFGSILTEIRKYDSNDPPNMTGHPSVINVKTQDQTTR